MSEEIRKAIMQLKNNKAPGFDQLINEYIKSTAGMMLPIYVYLFNKILNTRENPEQWLIGKIIPIYKGKADIRDPITIGDNIIELLREAFYTSPK